MTKLTDTLKSALAKKNGTHHLEGSDAPVVEAKVKKARSGPVQKPVTRSAGRGR